MTVLFSLLNAVCVSLFGSVLSASFCGALDKRRDRLIFWCCMALILVLQGAVYHIWDAEFLRYIYPLIIHFPLMIVLQLLTGRPGWPIVSILTAYLCCELRRWIALLVTALLGGGGMLQDIIELVVTLPLLPILLRFLTPVIRKLSEQPIRLRWQFGIIPIIYYVFDYGTRVYTDLLYRGSSVAVEFMPFICCVAYIVFLVYFTTEAHKREQLRQVQKSLDVQVAQAIREINALRESHALTCQYRHDMRHHLQYISACITNGQPEQAQTYISGICQEIESQKVMRYCENESANLILSAFDARAKKNGIAITVQGSLPTNLLISDSDLCVLLSNALETALNACQSLIADGADCTVSVQFYERDGKLFLQVINPCSEDIRFEDGIPVTDRPDHGIGVQSICAIVQKYGGVQTFLVRDGQFVLRLSI